MSVQIRNMLGLAQRAGKVVSGEASVENAIRRGKVKMLILAEDASLNTSKLFRNMSNHANISLYVYGTKIELGVAIGKSPRSAIAIIDDNFVRGIKRYMPV